MSQVIALLAASAAAIALVFLFSEGSASRETARELQEDVRRLNERTEAAGKARSEADTADDRSRSLGEQVDELESRAADANENDDVTQRQVAELNDELSDDIQQLRESVDRLERADDR